MIHEANPSQPIIPWWVRRKAPWHGDFFKQMVLADDDPREERIQELRNRMLPAGRMRNSNCLWIKPVW